MKTHLKTYGIHYASVAIILTTGILEYWSPRGVLLSWGYMVGMMLPLISGKGRDIMVPLTLSLIFVSLAFFRIEDQVQMQTVVLTRVYALLGFIFISFFLVSNARRERKAEDAKSLMAGIFSHGTQGILLTGMEGNIVMVNPYIEKLFGYTHNELQNQNISLLLPGVVFSKKEISSSATGSPEFRKHVTAFKKNNHDVFPVEITSSFYESAGKMYVATFLTDITVRKQNEDDLLRQKNELEVVNQHLEAFSYSVSHDLRSPLRGVGGYATMLREDYGQTMDAEANRMLGNIEQSATQMGILIDDLLTFSRLGRKELRRSEIDMTSVTARVHKEINSNYKNRAEVIIQQLHSVRADASLIGHVMTNLLSNAIKYSSKNMAPQIEISSSLEGNFVIFCIKDNGVGFDMNYAHKLFQVFQRLHLAIEFEGTGVGLAIAERIVQKHGGKIWAEAVENVGATFYFSLPVDTQVSQESNNGISPFPKYSPFAKTDNG